MKLRKLYNIELVLHSQTALKFYDWIEVSQHTSQWKMISQCSMSCRRFVRNWSTIKRHWKKFWRLMLKCGCLRLNIVPQSIRKLSPAVWLQTQHWIEFQCFLIKSFLQNTQHSRQKFYKFFQGLGFLPLVFGFSRAALWTGAGFELGNKCGCCGWDYWMTWRDRSRWLVWSKSWFFSPKRMDHLCIACQHCFQTATKFHILISGFKWFKVEKFSFGERLIYSSVHQHNFGFSVSYNEPCK